MLRDGIIQTAQAIGADPLDLATVISYETAGTFDPTKRGPTTQWGQHRGLIQFGEPQARQYGVDWNDPVGSQLGQDGAVARYFKASGFKPGMGLLDLYSTVNAGAPGRYNASDANNGGAPGTVQDKVMNQMAPHRQKAAQLLGMSEGETMNSTISTRGAIPQQGAEERPLGLMGLLGGGSQQDDRGAALDQIALGLMSMSAYPTAGMRAQMGAIQERAQDRRGEKKASAQRNKTAAWLRSQGLRQLADGVEAGALTAAQAMQMAQQRPDRVKGVVVDGRLVNPYTGAVMGDYTGGETEATTAVQTLMQRAQAAGLEPGTEAYREFMLRGGAQNGMALEVGPDGTVRFSQGGAAGKPLTEGQSKDTTYAVRAEGALPTLDKYDTELTKIGERALDADPTGVVRGNLQSPKYQMAKQAGDEFLQAILRKDTGAAITEGEQILYGKTYLPQLGDGPEVIAQKRQARQRALDALKAGMSPHAILAQEKALQARGGDVDGGGDVDDDALFEKYGVQK